MRICIINWNLLPKLKLIKNMKFVNEYSSYFNSSFKIYLNIS